MQRRFSANSQFAAIVLTLGLAACASTDDATKGGYYKVGSPYQIKGVWYYPKEDPNYDETGVASWYGDAFHGKKTANGERYDMHAMTAAHRTLPMPTFVNVTNMDNGKQVNLRVNDRGPYAHGRIIDVSMRAAELLGFKGAGTAKVRVQFAGTDESSRPVAANTIKAAPVAEVTMEALPAPGQTGRGEQGAPIQTASLGPGLPISAVEPPRADETVRQVGVSGRTQLWIQTGAFEARENANRQAAQLRSSGNVSVSSKSTYGKPIYQVRIGPIAAVETADIKLEEVIAAGFNGARIVVE
jgi:rare lipoprotein A